MGQVHRQAKIQLRCQNGCGRVTHIAPAIQDKTGLARFVCLLVLITGAPILPPERKKPLSLDRGFFIRDCIDSHILVAGA